MKIKRMAKKLFAVSTGVVMLGATAMGAMAADLGNYPDMFVEDGEFNGYFVVGENAATVDTLATIDISNAMKYMAAGDTSTTTVSGEAVSLESGGDEIYLNDELNENIATLTKDDLANVLADGTFTDDDGTDYDYEQVITVGANGIFAFSDSSNDVDDPTMMVELETNTGSPVYTWEITFDDAVNFTHSDSEGEELVLFGKTYTVGTASDSDTLVLLGGADTATVNVGESIDLVVAEESYAVELLGLDASSTTKASISVNGVSKTFTEGQTKTVGDVEVYVKTVFKTDDNQGYVEVELGADELTFETGDSVKIGSDADDIDGTLITITGGVDAMTKMEVAIVAEDNDVDYILEGESFVDSVFGTVDLLFSDVVNGPSFEGEADTGRAMFNIDIEGDDELSITITDENGDVKTIPFNYQGSLTDDNGETIHVVEGTVMTDDDYFFLNSGNYHHFMQVTKVDTDQTNGDVHFKDLFTGTEYKIDDDTDLDADEESETITIKGQTYTVYVEDASENEIRIYSDDYSLTSGTGDVAVFPYLELVGGMDHRIALTDDVTLANVTAGTTIELPSGDLADLTGNSTSSGLVGTVYYHISSNATGATTQNITIGISTVAGSAGAMETEPGVLFVEEEDKSDSDTKNAIFLATTYSGGYAQVSTPAFTGNSDTETWDDTDFVGYLTNYGSYVLKDGSDDHQQIVSVSYPENPMYAEVYFKAGDAVTTTSSDGTLTKVEIVDASKLDSEIADVSANNLIVVGGPCANSVAAELMGNPADCAEGFTAGTARIKLFENGESVAMLVAGYSGAGTRLAGRVIAHRYDEMSGDEIEVSGTTYSDASMGAPVVVVEEPEVADEE